MKKLIAILLSVVCIIGLFCGCKDKKEEKKDPVILNLLNCGFEFGMSQEEVNAVGYKNINPEFDESEFIAYEAEVDRFLEGVEVVPTIRILFNFGVEDSLEYIYVLMQADSENDAETILNNALNEYREVGAFTEFEKKGIPTYIAENENMQVYIDYTAEYKKVRIILALPGVEIPIY